jgi:hypothetical protein
MFDRTSSFRFSVAAVVMFSMPIIQPFTAGISDVSTVQDQCTTSAYPLLSGLFRKLFGGRSRSSRERRNGLLLFMLIDPDKQVS